MRSSFNQKLARRLGAIALVLCFVLSGAAPVLAQNADPGHLPHGPQGGPPADNPPTWDQELVTLRQATGGKMVDLKVNGDGMHTTSVSLQIKNLTDKPIKLVIPANEVLHPNVGSIQTMMIQNDIIMPIQPGEIGIAFIKTVCASPKTVPPPPEVTQGINFNVGDYADPAVWGQLASIIAAGKELDLTGAFGDLLMPTTDVLNKEVDSEIQNQLKKKIAEYQASQPGMTESEARAAIEGNKDEMNAIRDKAKRLVTHQERQKRLDQITQLAIWRLLGIKSGKPEDAVTPVSMVDDFLKQLALQAKNNPGLLTQTGAKLDKNGNVVASPKQREGLEQAYNALFQVVDLTVNRSQSPALTGVASLPKDDPCDTFCSVGERAYNQGDFTNAQELLNSAVKLTAKMDQTDPRVSRSLNSLGLVYLNMTYFTDAEDAFKKALNNRTKVFGEESKEVAEVKNNLGMVDQGNAKFGDAADLFQSAANIYEKAIGKTSPSVAGSLNNLGKTFCLDTKPNDGIDKLQLALALAMVNSPQNVKGEKCYTPFVAEVETNLADAYKDTGDNRKATELYKKALDTDRVTLGPEHPFLANILDGLSTVTSKTGDVSLSEDFKKQADTIREKTFLAGSKDLAALPFGTEDLGRLWNYIQGKKDIEFTITSVKAASAVPAALDLTRNQAPVKDKWALVVGISKFQDPTISLQYAAKDAKDFSDFLINEENFAPDHVRTLLNERATRAEIINQYSSWLARVAQKDDLVLIFFSSHGSPSVMDLAAVNFLVTYDTDKRHLASSAIKLQDFAQTVKDYVHSDRIVMLMDACHSGAAQGAKGFLRTQNVDAGSIAQGTGQMVICSSDASQSSWESKNYKNGVFTHYLIEGLRKQDDSHKPVGLGKVFQYLQDGVTSEVQRDRGAQQTPVLKSKWRGDDLIVGIKPAAPHEGIKDDWQPSSLAGNAASKSVLGNGTGTTGLKTTAAKPKGGGTASAVHKPATTISKQPANKPKTAVH